MDVRQIRRLLGRHHYSVSRHAVVEAFSDGLSLPDDILTPLRRGVIIEDYPNRNRALVLGYTNLARPVHIVIELTSGGAGTGHLRVVTVYVPSVENWDPDWTTRRQV